MVLLLTALYVIINPNVIYDSGSPYEVNTSNVFGCDQFHVFPEKNNWDIISAINISSGSTRFIFRNFETNLMKEIETRYLSIKSNFTKEIPKFYFNETSDILYLIGTYNRADYHLISLADDITVKVSRKFLFRNRYFDELGEDSISLDGKIITSCKFADTHPDTVDITWNDTGYEIILSNSHLNSLLQNELNLKKAYTVFVDLINPTGKVI